MPLIDSKEAPTTSSVSEGSPAMDEGREIKKSRESSFISSGSRKSPTIDTDSIEAQPISLELPSYTIPIPRNSTLIFAEFEYIKLGHVNPAKRHFPKPTPAKGAYILFEKDCLPSHRLIFKFTSSSRKETTKKYKFPEFEEPQWFYLPIDLPNIVRFELLVEDSEQEDFEVKSLAFVREEIPKESIDRKSREIALEKLWSEVTPMKSEFMNEGSRHSIPIPRDDPTIIDPAYEMVNGSDYSYSKELREYNKSLDAQKMLRGEGEVFISNLSFPFPAPSPIEGAYICVEKGDSSPSLLFTFTLSDGTKISKKYEFSEPKHYYEWHYLHTDLLNVIKCEIEGNGMWIDEDNRVFNIKSLVFIQERLVLSTTDTIIYTDTIKVQPINQTLPYIIPIPRDDPTLIFAEFKYIELEHDKPVEFPFPKPASTKGAYIFRQWLDLPFHRLIFKFTSSSGEKTTKHYTFPRYGEHEWFYLPIDLPNIARFEMIVEDSKKKKVKIQSLAFVREETPEESAVHKFKESLKKLWSKATSVTPKFMNEGDRYSIPIPRDDPTLIDPSFEMVNGSNNSYSKELHGYEVTEYDKSWEAQRMLKGKWDVTLSHLSIPFPSPSPMKGAYICVGKKSYMCEYTSSPSLLFTFTLSDGTKTSKKYEFKRPKHDYKWHFLPIDLSNVVLCEIEGKGTWKEKSSRVFNIESLVFIREETYEERTAREVHERCWAEATISKPEFMNPGNASFIPIPRDDPDIINPSFELVKGKDDSKGKESEEYDMSSRAQRMLKGEDDVTLSHLSIPFPAPSSIKGAYICVEENNSSPSLLFTFTLSDGTKTFKKYEFTQPKHDYEWFFLSIDLDNVILCEIEGKGTWKKKNSRDFCINSLVFLKRHRYIKEVTFVHEGGYSCIPIPRDAPNIIDPAFGGIETRNETRGSGRDRRDFAKKMIKGEGLGDYFTHISIPFKSPTTPIKGAYICLPSSSHFAFPIQLIFTFTSSTGNVSSEKIQSIKYNFDDIALDSWFFQPIYLSDVVLCEIEGESKQEGKKRFEFCLKSLVFFREETVEEKNTRKSTEVLISKMWTEASTIIPEFIAEGDDDSPLIYRDDPLVINPSFELVKGKNDSMSKESEKYDMSSRAQEMLMGEDDSVILSHLSIPFLSPNPMKGAYICVNKYFGSPSLLFTFTLSNGKKIPKKYEFSEPKHWGERHFLPIGLDNVVLCEIQGKGRWREKNSRAFRINSLFFITGQSLLPISPHTVVFDTRKTITSKILCECIRDKENVNKESIVIHTHVFNQTFATNLFDSSLVEAINSSKRFYRIHIIAYSVEAIIPVDHIKEVFKKDLKDDRVLLIQLPSGIVIHKSNLNPEIQVFDYHKAVKEVDEEISSGRFSFDTFESKLQDSKQFGLNLLYRGIIARHITVKCDHDMSTIISLRNLCQGDFHKKFGDLRLIDYAAQYGDVMVLRELVRHEDYDVYSLIDYEDMHTCRDSPCYKIPYTSVEVAIVSPFDSPEIISELLQPPMGKNPKRIIRSFIDEYRESGWSLIGLAVEHDKPKIVEYLLNLGANPCQSIFRGNFETPLARALSRESGEACAKLLVSVEHDWPCKFEERFSWHKTIIKPIIEYTQLLQRGDIIEIEKRIKDKAMVSTWRSLENHSAPYVSFVAKRYNSYALLRSHGYLPLRSEREHVSMSIDNLEGIDRQHLKNAFVERSVSIDSSLVLFMLSKTRIFSLQRDNNYYFETMRKAYNDLDEISLIRILLQILEAYGGKFDIIVDFGNDNVAEISGTPGKGVLGSAESTGRIYIVGKVYDVYENDPYFDMLGTIAHELTHLAMEFVFKNGCKPYPFSKVSQIPRNYKTAILETQKVLKCGYEIPILGSVFTEYEKAKWPAEIIARVPQILAYYGQADGTDILKTRVPLLFSWYKDILLEKLCKIFDQNAKRSSTRIMHRYAELPEKQLLISSNSSKPDIITCSSTQEKENHIVTNGNDILFLFSMEYVQRYCIERYLSLHGTPKPLLNMNNAQRRAAEDKEMSTILKRQIIADLEADRDKKGVHDCSSLKEVSDIQEIEQWRAPRFIETTSSHSTSSNSNFDLITLSRIDIMVDNEI
ncbi:hypothetical protein ADUPG1_000209 [Aduncisulcus paluster]|uniref:Uncharacterized protein n=1 Tax=Aduncisulcus paluster TaxID=2918883 RepID=A0ABQ5K5J2_9EUKA|nr:hypothetical protein ADUPG1_000209 [Aduncisulcus paluster]